ncbi:MAG: hypothetical protein ACFFEW_18350 [Candidatus Thorarchaeota archaeon]
MLPKEYLELLQSAYRYHPEMLDLRNVISRVPGESPSRPSTLPEYYFKADGKKFADITIHDPVEFNFNHLLSTLPDDTAACFNDTSKLAVGEIESADVNGSAIPIPDSEGWVITIRRGLSYLIYHIIRTLSMTYNWNEPTSGTLIQSRLERSEAAQAIGEVLNYYCKLGVVYGKSFDANNHHIWFADVVATAAHRFVLCHELAHFVLGHTTRSNLNAVDDGATTFSESARKHDQELAADLEGWSLLFMSAMTADVTNSQGLPYVAPNNLTASYAGASTFIQISDLIDTVCGRREMSSHPEAQVRLDRLREYAVIACDAVKLDVKQISGFEEALSDALGDVRAWIVENLEILQKSPFNKLASECAASNPPDYNTFYQTCLTWMSQGSPHKFCRMLGYHQAEMENELGLDSAKDNGPSFESLAKQIGRDAIVSKINHLKLITGLLSNLNAESNLKVDKYYRKGKAEIEGMT